VKKREYRDYLIDIATSINDIESFIEGMTYEDFLNDKMASNAVIRSLEVIGEATKNLPKAIRDRDTSIPWKKMAGMRDKIIHEYFGVNYETVWKTAKKILPGLKDKISHLIEQKISDDK
jgi:uncharacterized protein with HEPN domain